MGLRWSRLTDSGVGSSACLALRMPRVSALANMRWFDEAEEIYSTPGVREGVHFQVHMGIRKGQANIVLVPDPEGQVVLVLWLRAQKAPLQWILGPASQ